MSSSVEFGAKTSTEGGDGLVDEVLTCTFVKDGDKTTGQWHQSDSISTVYMTLSQVKIEGIVSITVDDVSSHEEPSTNGGDPEDNRFIRRAVKYQNLISNCWKRHVELISLVIYVVLVVAYFTYFTYALYFRFGDIDSVRLLYITCVVVAVMAWQLLNRCIEAGKVRPFSSWLPIKYCLEHDVVVTRSTLLPVCKRQSTNTSH